MGITKWSDEDITTCQLHMRHFNISDTITITGASGISCYTRLDGRSYAFDKIMQAGGPT